MLTSVSVQTATSVSSGILCHCKSLHHKTTVHSFQDNCSRAGTKLLQTKGCKLCKVFFPRKIQLDTVLWTWNGCTIMLDWLVWESVEQELTTVDNTSLKWHLRNLWHQLLQCHPFWRRSKKFHFLDTSEKSSVPKIESEYFLLLPSHYFTWISTLFNSFKVGIHRNMLLQNYNNLLAF